MKYYNNQLNEVQIPTENGNPIVYQKDEVKGFYFFDEYWDVKHGPFNTEEEAREALSKYSETI